MIVKTTGKHIKRTEKNIPTDLLGKGETAGARNPPPPTLTTKVNFTANRMPKHGAKFRVTWIHRCSRMT